MRKKCNSKRPGKNYVTNSLTFTALIVIVQGSYYDWWFCNCPLYRLSIFTRTTLTTHEKTPLDYEVIMATFLAEKIYLAFSRNTVVLTDP